MAEGETVRQTTRLADVEVIQVIPVDIPDGETISGVQADPVGFLDAVQPVIQPEGQLFD